MNAQLQEFEHIKELYAHYSNFNSTFNECKSSSIDNFNKLDGYLFQNNRLCILKYSFRELLVREANRGKLMGH